MSRSHQEAYERLVDQEHRYATTILLLGYGGFFALWGGQAGQMPKLWFGVAGLLMGISLILFLGFELGKTFAKSKAFHEADRRGQSAEEAIDLANVYVRRVDRWWLPVFAIAVLTGMSAGAIVLWHFGLHAVRNAWG